MPKLTVQRGAQAAALPFSGTPTLAQVLAQGPFALSQPCGGRGTCGKCAVQALTGVVSPPTAAENKLGVRLACQTVLLGDCAVTLPPVQTWADAETDAAVPTLGTPMPGRCGAAVDLGTTTVAARVFDLQTGAPLAAHTLLNPQTAVAADVMGRITAALQGGLPTLQRQAREAVTAAIAGACAQAGMDAVQAVTLAGNTTMLYLLTGRSPQTLATAPFAADALFGGETMLAGTPVYLPPCAATFIGADITCAALAAGLDEAPDTVLLMDIGTNGELLLRHGGQLYGASTAAGPAFEGGQISQGCGGIQGAIDRVWLEGGTLGAHVIGGGKAVGVCGSGLLDAVAALLEAGRIDASGQTDAPVIPLRDGVTLTAADVRAVQLAKAAIAAGVESLLAAAEIEAAQVSRVLLAGGFGSRLRVQSAAAIGLIPAPLGSRASPIGNAALAGAAMLLLDTRLRKRVEALAQAVRVVPLGGDAQFEQRFLAAMRFPYAYDEDE